MNNVGINDMNSPNTNDCHVSNTNTVLYAEKLSKLEFKKCDKDGHCLISAFLHSIHSQIGGEAFLLNVNDIRENVWDHVNKNFEIYESLLTTTTTKEAFVDKLYMYLFKNDSNLEIVDFIPYMLASIYNVNIVIVDTQSSQTINVTPRSSNPATKDIFISKTGEHYDSYVVKPRVVHSPKN